MNQFYFVDILFSSANKNQFFSLLCMSNTFKKLYKSNSNYTCSLPPFVFCFQSCSVKHLVGTNDNYRVRTWHSDTVKLTGEFSYKWRRWEHLLGVKSSQFYIYRANSQQNLFHDTCQFKPAQIIFLDLFMTQHFPWWTSTLAIVARKHWLHHSCPRWSYQKLQQEIKFRNRSMMQPVDIITFQLSCSTSLCRTPEGNVAQALWLISSPDSSQ